MQWANPGIRVIPSCGTKLCPISKQATNQRKANREKNCIKASVLWKDLRKLHRFMYCDVISQDEIAKEITVKEKACKTDKTASSNVIQADMTEVSDCRKYNFLCERYEFQCRTHCVYVRCKHKRKGVSSNGCITDIFVHYL